MPVKCWCWSRVTCFLSVGSALSVEDLALRGNLCLRGSTLGGSGWAAPTAQLRSQPSCVCSQSRALSALPCPSWRLLLLRCVWGLWSSAFFYAEMLQVSLVLGELVSLKGGSAGRYKTCRGTSCLCPPWKRAVWAPVELAVNLYC